MRVFSSQIWQLGDRCLPAYKRLGFYNITSVQWDPLGWGFYVGSVDSTFVSACLCC